MNSSSELRAGVPLAGSRPAPWAPQPLAEEEPPIRMADLKRALQTAVARARADANAEADRRLEALERALREEAEAALERSARESYAHGFEEGRAEGARSEAARLEEAVGIAEAALGQLHAGEERWRALLEENLAALSIGIARQIIGREIALDPAPVQELVRTALREFPIDRPVRIRVHPADLELIAPGETHDPADPLLAGREGRWLADPAIERGGCVVEGRERIVDGRVDTALERLYRRLTHTHA